MPFNATGDIRLPSIWNFNGYELEPAQFESPHSIRTSFRNANEFALLIRARHIQLGLSDLT